MRAAVLARYVPDLRRDPFHRWLEKWHALPLLVLSVVLALWGIIREGPFLAASLVSWGIFLGLPLRYMVLGWLTLPRTLGPPAFCDA